VASLHRAARRGRLIVPVLAEGPPATRVAGERTIDGVRSTSIADVLYVSLRGGHGVGSDPDL
jgi:hypothetical protein